MPASAAAPSGSWLARAPTVGQAAAVALEHLIVGHQVMTEADRLGDLQVSEARHHGVDMALSDID